MTPHEFFTHIEKVAEANGESVEHTLDAYWAFEFGLAGIAGARTSFLKYMQDPADRTCSLCGHVNDTDERGELPDFCANPRCAEVRRFWCINGIWTFTPKATTKRGAFLRSRLEMVFGVRTIHAAPEELRFEFLASAMIERIAHESQH